MINATRCSLDNCYRQVHPVALPRHRITGKYYCLVCARRMNDACEERLVEIGETVNEDNYMVPAEFPWGWYSHGESNQRTGVYRGDLAWFEDHGLVDDGQWSNIVLTPELALNYYTQRSYQFEASTVVGGGINFHGLRPRDVTPTDEYLDLLRADLRLHWSDRKPTRLL